MAVLEIFLLLVCAALTAVYFWCKQNFSYWQRHGVPYMEPTPILGNTKDCLTLKNCFGLYLSDVYNDKRNADAPVVGIYILNKPALVIRELELVKSILIKDFSKFSNRYGACDPHGDALAANNIFFVRNPQWKEIRTKISPVFTSGKIKQMYPLMLEIAAELEKHLGTYAKTQNSFISEIKEICAAFTTDNIANIAFGVRANCLQDPNAEFRVQGRKVFDFNIRRAIDFSVSFFLPKMTTVLKTTLFPKEFSAFLRKSIAFVIEERERSGITRNDLIDILVALKREAAAEPEKKHFASNSDFLVAQAAVFLTAGFETSSSTMAFGLYELAKQPQLQKRLREEICEAIQEDGGKISYEKIMSMEYLGMVLDEVLRLYPILPFLDRQYLGVTGEPNHTLKPYLDYTFENGVPVFIPIFGLQRDPKYWPNPNHFDPERFSPQNRKNINPMTYLPFGTGPHNCIGNRIGLLQAKIGLVHFFKNHYIETCKDTPAEIVFDPKALLLQNTGPINLKVINDSMYDNKATNL